jgi:hypothetical protein
MGVAGAALPLALPGSPASAGDSRRVFDVREFGARGDGVTVDSPAINRAVAAAARSGGTVHFPPGTYAAYSIRLRSHVALYLDQNATILAAKPADGRGYDPAEPGAGNPYQDFGHSHWHNSLIWGEGLDDVTIHGPGRIDGAGLVSGGSQESAPLQGNKAIALKLCRNVAIRDITIVNGGHFGILPTGVDNFRIDGLVIDTNRDGINIDCCRNVRIANTTVNSPNDDAIVLKSSYALNEARATENVTIDNCMVSGYRLSDVMVYDADPRYPSAIAGIPGHPVEDVRISNVRQVLAGGLTPGEAVQDPPELESAYPEPTMFGTLPAFGFFVRHAAGITMENVDIRFRQADTRPAVIMRDVRDADFHHDRAGTAPGVPAFVLDQVDDFTVTTSRPVADIHLDHVDHRELP